MKLLCTADWHAHNFSDFSHMINVRWDERVCRYLTSDTDESTSMNSRLLDTLTAICDMRDYMVVNGISTMLFAGDMFHHRGTIDVTVFNPVHKVLSTFSMMGLEVLAIAGNHDQVDNSIRPMSALETLGDVITVVTEPTVKYPDGSVPVVLIPYSKDKEYICDSIEEMLPQYGNGVLVAHLGVDGATVGSGMRSVREEYTLSNLHYDHWHYIVLGHYHQPQLLSDNTFYCGAPVQNNFNDELPSTVQGGGYNGFYVIDTDKRYDAEFVPITSVPRFITVTSADEIASMSSDMLSYNHIRVRAQADQADDIQTALDSVTDDPDSVRLELEREYTVEHRSDISVVQSTADTVRTYATENWTDSGSLELVTAVGLSILSESQEGGK